MKSLSERIAAFAGRRILIAGDFMLDHYVIGDTERISPEAPVPVLRVVERQDRVGGAGSVALNVVALGAWAACFGLVGHDREGERILALLRDAGADVEAIRCVDDRPTICKTRVSGLAEHRHRQQLLRIDDELIRAAAPHDADALVSALRARMLAADALCLEDYAKGLLTPAFCQSAIAAARAAGKPVLVDPSRSRDWDKYAGATLLTPNRAELEHAVGRRLDENELVPAATEIVRRLGLRHLVVTLGRDGALRIDADGVSEHFPTQPRAVYDNTGAGDAVLATMAVALAAGADVDDAIRLANVSGGLEVSKFGCVPITRDELQRELQSGAAARGKIRDLGELEAELHARRARGETVVFTNGCFDLLHPGHVELLEQARRLGSLLVVAVNSDNSVRAQNKGADRPIRSEAARARMLAALGCVDYVIVFGEDEPKRLLERLRPEILVKGGDCRTRGVVGREIVEGYGGRVMLIDLVDGYGTTRELERIRGG